MKHCSTQTNVNRLLILTHREELFNTVQCESAPNPFGMARIKMNREELFNPVQCQSAANPFEMARIKMKFQYMENTSRKPVFFCLHAS